MRETPFWRRYQRLFRNDLEADAQDELDTHIALRVEDLIRQGRTEAEARAQAEREFGDMARIRREMNRLGRKRRRRQRRATWWSSIDQDIRYAVRMLRTSPGFAAVVVLTLALGIGGTTAVFSVVQAVLLAPLPYEQPGQLVRLYQLDPGDASVRRTLLSGPHFRHIRDHATSFQRVAGARTYSETGRDLIRDGRAERLRVLPVTKDYFRTLGSTVQRGREFSREDEVGTSRVVLSDDLWRTRFDGDPSVIGTTIRLSDRPAEVIGIAPPEFEDPIAGQVDLWMPFNFAGQTNELASSYVLASVGRLRNGVSLEQARAELAVMSQAMAERWPVGRNVIDASLLKDDRVATARSPLRLLLIAVGLVLLLACVNVANLALVRATSRTHEFAIRSALGSGGVRIARLLLVESMILAVLGGLLGLALAGLGVEVLKVLGHDAIPRLDEVGFAPVILGFAVLVTLATAIAFGIAPAIRFARIDPKRALGQQSRSATSARGQARLRGGLAAAQLALALTLLAGAGVLMASFHRLRELDLGFRADRVLTFDLTLPSARYDTTRRVIFQQELARGLWTIPGVTAAGGITYLPATGSYNPWFTVINTGPLAGDTMSSGRGTPNLQQRLVVGDYFAALEIPLLAGRAFEAQDNTSDPARAVVSAHFAERAFPGMPFEDVVGQRITVPAAGGDRDIIGVVGDVPLDARGSPALIVYHANSNLVYPRTRLAYVVAAELPPERILRAVREEVAALDAELVVYNTAPMSEIVGQGVSRERFVLALMGAFAVVALTLAALGLYGVLAYTVRSRTQEIGIRIALGASIGHVHRLVLRQAAIVVGIGLVAGTGGALVLGRWLSSLVFEISPSDPRILAAMALLLTITALLSAWLPLRRASQVNPLITMQAS